MDTAFGTIRQDALAVEALVKVPLRTPGVAERAQNLCGVFSEKKPCATCQMVSGIPDASSKISITPSTLCRPAYTGDFVVVVNAERVRLTGNKREAKVYARHTGWPGGFKTTTAAKVLDGPHPERVVEQAVKGMLPKNKLAAPMFKRLKVYVGPEHPHKAQAPKALSFA